MYISDALSQNILILCYEKAQRVEEIAKATGVPAYYVEERIDNLLNHLVLKEESREKYRTDLLIWTDEYGKYSEQHAAECMRPVLPRLLEAMQAFAEDALTIPFHRGRRNENDLFYILNCAAFYDEMRLSDRGAYPPIPVQTDGYRWRYVASMETGAHPRLRFDVHSCSNNGQRGRYAHTSFDPCAARGNRSMMYDAEINICQEVLETGSAANRELASSMLEKGLLYRMNGKLAVDMPAFTREQRLLLGTAVDRHLHAVFPAYSACVERFMTGYRKLFPKHLQEDGARQSHYTYFSMLKVMLEEGRRAGAFPPETPGTPWDMLSQI